MASVSFAVAARYFIRLVRVAVAEFLLPDLAHGVARDLVDDLELLGNLLSGQADGAAVLGDVGERQVVHTVLELDDRAASLTRLGVGDRDDRDIDDPRVAVQHVFYLGGGDVLGVPDHHVFQAARDPHVAGREHGTEVARAQVAVVVEGVVHQIGARVAAEELRPVQTQLSGFARITFDPVGPDDPDLHAG